MEAGRLGVGEFAFPGPLCDQLVAAILDGEDVDLAAPRQACTGAHTG